GHPVEREGPLRQSDEPRRARPPRVHDAAGAPPPRDAVANAAPASSDKRAGTVDGSAASSSNARAIEASVITGLCALTITSGSSAESRSTSGRKRASSTIQSHRAHARAWDQHH